MSEKTDPDFIDYYKSLPNSPARVFVPAYERVKQLYAFGYSDVQILDVISSEFSDSMLNPLTLKDISRMIFENINEFKMARATMGRKCGDELAVQAATLYRMAHKAESRLVSVYVEKLGKATEQLSELDLDEKDDDGNYAHTRRIFILLELIDKLQSKISKIAGTDAMREIEVTKQKLKLRLQYAPNNNSLLPDPIEADITEERPNTKFV